jgi:multicomponent Na+:H+ antiporter subunit E
VRTRAAVTRGAGLALTWWILAEGALPRSTAGAVIATVTIVVATGVSLMSWPPGSGPVRIAGLPGFAVHFIRQSAAGGVDVARRALLPSGRVQPGFIRYRTDLAPGAPRTLLAGVISLLPGSLTVEIDGRYLVIHVLDEHLPIEESVRAIERRIDGMLPRAPAGPSE